MRLSVCKEVVFDAAHMLPGYNGPCCRLHGHQWKVEVEVSGPMNTITGMVVDFVRLKAMMKTLIVDKFDHQYINDFFDMPTAEFMVTHLVEQLQDIDLGMNIRLERIRLYETPTSFCQWQRGIE